jgi:hypothetical protein
MQEFRPKVASAIDITDKISPQNVKIMDCNYGLHIGNFSWLSTAKI